MNTALMSYIQTFKTIDHLHQRITASSSMDQKILRLLEALYGLWAKVFANKHESKFSRGISYMGWATLFSEEVYF